MLDKSEENYISLEDLASVLSESGYMCLGHGTGRSGDSEEIVDAIFQEGLRTKDNSLYYTTVGLSTPTPELKQQYAEFGLPEPTIADLKKQFNNWQHLDSQKIIIIRIPTAYINMMGDRGDLDGEMYGAFMLKKATQDGKIINYLNPKFIVGCFDVEKQLVKLNPGFERQLSSSTIQELTSQYKETLEKTKERLDRSVSTFPEDTVNDSLVINEYSENADLTDLDWEDTTSNSKER